MHAMTDHRGLALLSGSEVWHVRDGFFMYDIRLQVHLIDQGQRE